MQLLIQTYLLLFVASSPIAYVAVFVAMTPQLSYEEKWQLARRGCNIAFGLIGLIACLGSFCLRCFCVSISVFRIAGGIIMGRMGMQMMQHVCESEGKVLTKNETVIPLAFPMIVGPGAISATLIARTNVQSFPQFCWFFGAVILLMLTFYILFYLACISSQFLSQMIITIIYKLSGFVVFLLSVDFLLKGFRAVICYQ